MKKMRGACTEYCRRVLVTYNRCQVAAEQRLDALPKHELFTQLLQSNYQEDEQKIQQVKYLDERILKNAVAHSAISIHLLEDQLCLSPTRIEVVKNQAAKYEINICFLNLQILKAQQQRPKRRKSSNSLNLCSCYECALVYSMKFPL